MSVLPDPNATERDPADAEGASDALPGRGQRGTRSGADVGASEEAALDPDLAARGDTAPSDEAGKRDEASGEARSAASTSSRKPSLEERLGLAPNEDAAKDRMQVARASAIGLQFAISIAIGALGGRWLDRRLDTEPYLLLVGVVLGAIAAFRDLFLLAKREADAESS